MIQLDKFQIDSINDIKDLNNVLVVAPTGSGKTLIAEKSVEYYIQNNKRSSSIIFFFDLIFCSSCFYSF